MNPMLQLSVTEMVQQLRAGDFSATALMAAHLHRLEVVNPKLNAVVHNLGLEALMRAEKADKSLASGEEDLPVLTGIPCTIKECFAFEGKPWTAGLMARKGLAATETAPTVQALVDAGAIPMGTTNLSELCMWMESNNRVYGRTLNPYDFSRTCGGSSGGEGAIIGAGASPFGLGSDVGGSIRMPAFFCGVFGHKPSSGLISNKGQYPVAQNDVDRYLSTGPICRRSEDLPLLMGVLAGTDRSKFEVTDFSMKNCKVLDVRGDGRLRVSKDLLSSQQRVVDWMKSQGADVQSLALPRFKHAIDIWSAKMANANPVRFEDLLFEGDGRSLMMECLRFPFGSPYTFPALGLSAIERLQGLMHGRMARFEQEGNQLREELEHLLEGDTILLFPSHPIVAPRHNHSMLFPLRWSYTAIFNVMELPVTQVPLGLNLKGLPLGIQVVGAHGRDDLTLSVAHALEKKFGGWVPPAHL